MKDKRKFAASISIRIGDSRIKLELAPAPDYGGPEGFYRVRAARRWLDTEDGQPRFLERDGIARIAAEIALCALEPPAPAPSIPEPSRVSVRRPDGFYDGGWTNTEPILNYEGRWVVHVLLAGKSGFVPVEDVIVHKERRRG